VPVQGSDFEIPIVVAVHRDRHQRKSVIQSTTPGLETNKRGYIQASETSQRTSRKGVFAGGDIVTGSVNRHPRNGGGPARGEVN
jgi:glutamate synthase (NADPH/NADH) small chain